ncbi:hypothetical protein JTE90_013973 [Oedothorax gibbosus]|uniref:RAP domain-containing protein n=1 Tax=Oedothorax gibbosus TaxID=931172 RepID=A0AAV6UDV7_9ARAC|nr:hypothetical protein JTE90_013973 [Oedothorax gibbosus]
MLANSKMLRRCIQLLSCREGLGYLYGRKLHTNSAKILYSSFNKDLPTPTLPTPLSKAYTHDTDILLDQLQKAKSMDKILELSSNHLDVMNAQHIVTVLNNIYDQSKEGKCKPEELMENQVFQALCSRLMKIVRVLDTQELITSYKVLSNLGIRSSSYVVSSILKMLGAHLNNMSLGQITFLSYMLSKQRHHPLVDGLRLALPLVLQVQIEQQLDSDNMTQVADCLQLACRSRLKPATIQKIVSTILTKSQTLSPTNATTILFAMLNMETPVEGYKALLNHSIQVVTKNIELSDEKQVIKILKLCHGQGFYHSPFYYEIAKKVVSEKWELGSTWEVIKTFSSVNFFPSSFLDHFASVLCLEAHTLRTSQDYPILNCVEYLSATGHRPPHLSAALRILCSCDSKIEVLRENSPFLLVKFLGCLAMMGHFPENVLSAALDEEYLFAAWSQSRKLGRSKEFERYLLSLHWSLEVFDQETNFTFPNTVFKTLVPSVFEKYSNHECPLQKFIENGLGGPQFLESKVFTRDGIFIDHMLAMRSGNYPVSLQNCQSSQSSSIKLQTVSFVEDYVLPTDAKIISVIVAHTEDYCKDPEVLRGYTDLRIKALAKKKFSPVVINYNTWRNLPDREKIPYLMQEIKQAVVDEPMGKTNVLF